jgi:hypothetical protein
MGCCGDKRTAVAIALGTSNADMHTPDARHGLGRAGVEFEYTGAQTLRVRGPITGRDYWFAQPGARVVVDGREASSLIGIPNLRRA